MNFLMDGVKFESFDIIDSTNQEAKRRFSKIKPNEFKTLHKTVLQAEEQTNGRGRLGRKFFSPKKSGLYFSVIYCCNKITNPGVITASGAVAVSRAIKEIFNVDSKIKWVNDVFVNDKKVCGILTEGIINPQTQQIEAVIIGIGINIVFDKSMPSELTQKAGGICNNSDFITQKTSFLKCILQNMYTILDNLSNQIEIAMNEYKARSNLIGKTITVFPIACCDEQKYDCQAVDITNDAKLVVKTQDGKLRHLESGEVSLHS